MRKIAKTAPILTLIAIMILSTLSVSAYGYEISISSGNGEFSGGSVYSKGIPATGTIDVDQASSTVTIGGTAYTLTKMPDGKAPADSKYFMAGIKLAGDDNSGANSGEIKLDAMYKDKDLEFVVAYGMKSSMVSYTVHYVANGVEIRNADTFYGVAGDNVIVSYKYVDGYIPQALTGVATLSSNSSENDFTFLYDAAEEGTGRTITINDGTTVINNGGGAAG